MHNPKLAASVFTQTVLHAVIGSNWHAEQVTPISDDTYSIVFKATEPILDSDGVMAIDTVMVTVMASKEEK
jgi:hypothetical protein